MTITIGAGVIIGIIAIVAWARSRPPAACPACQCAIRLRTMRKRQLRCKICKVQVVVAPGWWRLRITDWWVDEPPPH